MSVSIKVENEVACLTINRPAQKNAISTQMWQQITTYVEALDEGTVRLLIIRGDGGVFSAGADLSEISKLENADAVNAYLANIKRAIDAVKAVKFPSIAVIQKYCFGGGCLLALACDLRYASEDAVFQIPVARNGLVLDDGIVARLTALVGPGNAKELTFLGKTLIASEAMRIGMVNGVFGSSQIDDEVQGIIRKIFESKALPLSQLKKQIDSLDSSANRSGHF